MKDHLFHLKRDFSLLHQINVSPILATILALILIMSNYTNIEQNACIIETSLWSYNLLNQDKK